MKKIALFAALALAGAHALAATPIQTMQAFHAALAAGDQAAALALLSPDIVIFESGYVERSRAEYASHHLASDIAFSRATTMKVTRHSEQVDGNTASVLEETETRGTFNGEAVNAVGLESALLRKSGDGWVIVHLHWSTRKAR
jgi:ketosteroid isomerase-like protein